ncbi:hypothetical protein H310_00868 [Aphanomyces invadans]|uniref:Uncharacterized protein n=1 Tax=Aphanomyces invadans TaxID=157072 RepID=A0A024UP44_9STRA|nr:hypothetical protein H310_00868 [Aphanomyces invadans]ETW08226.1 hypothetical protein H310_00868 [Aphanomyces invadans]|eukprot:XP_008862031.1 hypothetical protein H310_00868 [Aphanomyces invadans]
MGDSSRGGGRKHSNQNLRPTRGGGGHHIPNAAPNAGIKSGMTVEDLKRLTQKRMQESAIAAAAAVAANVSVHAGEVLTPKARPTISVPLGTPQHAVPAPCAVFTPKTGMSVQELKQLTTLRLASQLTPTHQQQQQQLPLTPTAASNGINTHSNDYKSMLQQYYSRVNTPTSSPGNTPKRLGGRSFTTDHQTSQQQQASPNIHLPNPGQATTRAAAVSADSRQRTQSIDNRRPGYTPDFHQVQQVEPQSFSPRHMNNSQRHPYDAIPDPPPPLSGYSTLGRQAVHFEADSFPPPPPGDDLGSFGVPTALPSWSPPPMRTKSLQDSRPTLSLYHHQPGFYPPPAAPASDDYDQSGPNGAFPPPPPGLTRRPSMTVPWQVAESVLHTPQQPTGRKQIVSVPETPFHQFAQAYPQTKGGLPNGAPSPPRMPLHRGTSGTSAAAAAAAAELNATPLVRQSSKDPSSAVAQPQVTRRGSFGNAAQMYRFRRRSKSRLDVARDLALLELNGEDGRYLSAEERDLMLQQQGGEDGYGPERFSASDLEDLKASDDFVPYFNHRGGPKLSIPPPPPPMDDDCDSDEAGLPMMSPNGAKLRKVAQLARSGSLSSEDKTRVKDEIIQNSLGMMSLLPDDLTSAPPGFAPQGGGWQKPKKSPSRPPGIVRGHPRAMSTDSSANPVSLEDRLALAAQRVAECVAKADMVEFQKAMDVLDKLRHEANQLMQQ